MRAFLVLILMVFSAPVRAADQETQLLEWTSRTGRMLASYHAALKTATDTVGSHAGRSNVPGVYAGGPACPQPYTVS